MADKKRKALIEALRALETLKQEQSSDAGKAKIEDLGDKMVAEFGSVMRAGDDDDDQTVGCGAQWLYPA